MLGLTLRRKQAEFEKLTRPHLDGLYRAALRMTVQVEAAEDLVQEACLKAYRAFHTFRKGTGYKAWLFKIMTNTYIDTCRRQREPWKVDYETLPQGEETLSNSQKSLLPSADPETSLLYKSFRDDALRAIASLSPEVRLVVVLAVFEEFSYEEIAQVVACPVGTVRSRLNRGRHQLRAYLREYANSGHATVQRASI
jgi:RNA polymerase sigma-70 factor (ECF subfamily)